MDEAQCERAALKARLSAAQARSAKAEAELQQRLWRGGGGGDGGGGDPYDVDVESRTALRRRTPANAPRMVNLIKPVTKRAEITRAVDAVDRFMLNSGHFLRTSAGARAVFLLYLALLHVWTLVLLAFSTHVTFDEMDEGPSSVTPK